MIDLTEYNGAIQWLQRGLAELTNKPDSEHLRDGIILSVEVTYNLSESTLRQALSQLSDDTSLAQLSSLELMRYAQDEGLALASGEMWLRYGLAIDQTQRTLGESFSESILPMLPQYLLELQAFAVRLEGRLVQVA
jgi:hypothetical protein